MNITNYPTYIRISNSTIHLPTPSLTDYQRKNSVMYVSVCNFVRCLGY
uniref:Uncharacterized protein n=1 Tax=Siphoviridae sp. ctGQT3 TaxID=2825412 RepID=A0A8S5UE72_9CAUD|nr:MAG TPA: hypothetical protein [Siphoviridae sp. ctGQT3]